MVENVSTDLILTHAIVLQNTQDNIVLKMSMSVPFVQIYVKMELHVPIQTVDIRVFVLMDSKEKIVKLMLTIVLNNLA